MTHSGPLPRTTHPPLLALDATQSLPPLFYLTSTLDATTSTLVDPATQPRRGLGGRRAGPLRVKFAVFVVLAFEWQLLQRVYRRRRSSGFNTRLVCRALFNRADPFRLFKIEADPSSASSRPALAACAPAAFELLRSSFHPSDSPTARPRRKAAQTSKSAETADSDDEFKPTPAPPKEKQKVQGKRKTKAAETDGEFDDNGSEWFEPPAKTVKRATVGKKGKSRRPKKLELFQSMPLDVLALIMSELDMRTVLSMSRTCSLFRRLLHSPQGTSVSRAVRFNTSQIPALTAGDPEDWMYALLLFDSTCQVCHKSRAQVTDWTLRVRACAKCMKANSKQRYKMYGMHSAHRVAWECVPESKWSPGYFDRGATYSFFWLPTIQAVSARLKELDGKPGFDEYVKEHKRIKQAATVDGAAIGRWHTTWQAVKNVEAWNAKLSRKEEINAKH
ncbi:hypothetical protein Rt10032_c01g0364 [Rhodotorula toruloides]|uniref:F-box domain-containing protein n=1 Tax=Rhodotorula toruloides TaxID=5286 RepID=A0A511K7S0_RHOTO|nr:hypothetical protein Rt10032_c01g0364 [Rhodotorula toruloides]